MKSGNERMKCWSDGRDSDRMQRREREEDDDVVGGEREEEEHGGRRERGRPKSH